MSDLTDAQERELLADLRTDLDEMREACADTALRAHERITQLADRLERLAQTLRDTVYAVEDRVRRLENSR